MIPSSSSNLFFVHQSYNTPKDHLASVDAKLTALISGGHSRLFHHTLTNLTLKRFLQDVIGHLKNVCASEFPHHTWHVLGFLRGDDVELPDELSEPGLDDQAKQELRDLLPMKEGKFGLRAAETSVETLEGLLSRLEETDFSHLQESSIGGKTDLHGLPRHVVQEITAFLPPQEREPLLRSNKSVAMAYLPELRANIASRMKYFDKRSFDFRLKSLDKNWAKYPSLRAKALKSWATSLQESVARDKPEIFDTLLAHIEQLPLDVIRTPLEKLIKNLAYAGGRETQQAWSADAYYTAVDRVLGLINGRLAQAESTTIRSERELSQQSLASQASSAAIEALAACYFTRAHPSPTELIQFNTIVALTKKLSGQSRSKSLVSLCRTWTNLCRLKDAETNIVRSFDALLEAIKDASMQVYPGSTSTWTSLSLESLALGLKSAQSERLRGAMLDRLFITISAMRRELEPTDRQLLLRCLKTQTSHWSDPVAKAAAQTKIANAIAEIKQSLKDKKD